MISSDAYAQVIRQAAYEAVAAVLGLPRDSDDGVVALRAVTSWLAFEHGAAALLDLAEELAVDAAEAFEAVASNEQRDPLTVADEWFHGVPHPTGPERDQGSWGRALAVDFARDSK